jgi:two-component system, chemotaxis family, chemotaxis protein CheY
MKANDAGRGVLLFAYGDCGLIPPAKQPMRKSRGDLGMQGIRALIVDDSSVMRKIVERALRQAGLDALMVFEAGSGTEGMEVLRTKEVDLILSDINMPTMDGLEFLRQIRAQNLAPGVPVVMLTTESSEEHVKQAIQAGARGYIRKPFTADQVKERVLPLVRAA